MWRKKMTWKDKVSDPVMLERLTGQVEHCYYELVEMAAQHWLAHGCMGMCKEYRTNMEAVKYTSEQLTQMLISYRRSELMREGKQMPVAAIPMIIDNPGGVDEFLKMLRSEP